MLPESHSLEFLRNFNLSDNLIDYTSTVEKLRYDILLFDYTQYNLFINFKSNTAFFTIIQIRTFYKYEKENLWKQYGLLRK